MITDRALLAYKQFCEEYLNYNISGRTYSVDKKSSPMNNYESNIAWTYRPYDYDRDSRLQDVGKSIMYGKINADLGSIPLADYGYGYRVGYRIPDKKADRILMKRDPEYRAKRLAEIEARKEKNRAAHELGQQRQKERIERKANPKKQSFLSQVVQAHKKHMKKIADSGRMIRDGITSK